jgi:Sec-independent protein translocase protein TatA
MSKIGARDLSHAVGQFKTAIAENRKALKAQNARIAELEYELAAAREREANATAAAKATASSSSSSSASGIGSGSSHSRGASQGGPGSVIIEGQNGHVGQVAAGIARLNHSE